MDTAREALPALPGVTGTARVGTTAVADARLDAGEVLLLSDPLDAQTARLLLDRLPDPGPDGPLVVDGLGAEGVEHVADGQRVRVVDGVVHDAPGEDEVADEGEVLASGRQLDAADLAGLLTPAPGDAPGPEAAPIPETLTSETPAEPRVAAVLGLARATESFLQAEPGLLLAGHGLPALATTVTGRPVVVVAHADHTEVVGLQRFVREQRPVLVVVGAAADAVLAEGWVPDVVVVDAEGGLRGVPSPETLAAVRDVVLVTPPEAAAGAGVAARAAAERAEVEVQTVVSAAAVEDLALLLAHHGGADLVVGVGLAGPLEGGSVHGSVLAARAAVGARLVDATAVRRLYAARPQPVHLALLLLAGLVALLAAVSVTAVGREWVESLSEAMAGLW